MIMNPDDYTKGDAFQAEKMSLFSTEWLPVCAEGQIAQPGDFLTVTVGGWSVVVVRGKDGDVRVLRNACRHQNMPVVGAPSGNCESFRCRFHGWVYDLQGHFLAAPPPMAPAKPGPEHDLQVLALARAGGMVFFSMGTPARLPELAVPSAPYSGTTITEMACNWKVVVEELQDGTRQGPLLNVTRSHIHQVVPHTFLRTRLFTHSFGATPDTIDTLKQTCEARQQAYQTGSS